MARLDGVERRHGDGQLVNRLHREGFAGVKITVEVVARQRARHANSSMGLGGDASDLKIELRMGGKREREKQKGVADRHRWGL
jgi:hypothetical protein